MKKTLLTLLAVFGMAIAAHGQKLVGGDISLLPDYETAGARYYDKDNNRITGDMIDYFKQQGWNAMRLRLFVDPSQAPQEDKDEGVRQDLEYVKKLGKRIKEAGLTFLLDFHYSDTWTDPGQHSTPSAWKDMSVEEMTTAIYDYTKDCLQQLNAEGATPDYIQTGNEITYGMLWPTAHVWPAGGDRDGGTWANFTAYLASAIKACKEECPQAKIVLQTEMSKASNVTNFYKEMAKYPAVEYDVMGISYYPHYHGTLATMEGVINVLTRNHPDKTIQLVETAAYHAYYPDDAKYSIADNFPTWTATEAGQLQFTNDLIAMLNNHANVDGLYWWWPEANEKGIPWQKAVTSGWNNASLFDNETGKALQALYVLKDFLGSSSGIREVAGQRHDDDSWYTLNGIRLKEQPTTKGIYIHQGKKQVYQ